jgi:hypothetical protein
VITTLQSLSVLPRPDSDENSCSVAIATAVVVRTSASTLIPNW